MSFDSLRKSIVAGDAKQVASILSGDDASQLLSEADPISNLTPLALALAGTFQPVVAVILDHGGSKLLQVQSKLNRSAERKGSVPPAGAVHVAHGDGVDSSQSTDGSADHRATIVASVQAVHVYCARFEAITEDEVTATGTALLDAGADFSARSSDGRSCLHWVAENHHFGATICRFLLNRCSGSVSADDRDNDGFVPLHAAVIAGNEPVFKMLVSAGCDVDVKTSDGRSVLVLAEQYSPDILAFLQQRGIGGPLPSPRRRTTSPKGGLAAESPRSRARKAKRNKAAASSMKKASRRASDSAPTTATETTTTTTADNDEPVPATSRLYTGKRDPRLLLELPPDAAARVALALDPIDLNMLCGVSRATRAALGVRNAAWYWNLVYYSCYHCANIFAWLHGSATLENSRELDPEKYRTVFLTRARRAKRRARSEGSLSSINSMCICCGYHRPRRERTVYSYSIFSQAYQSLTPSLTDDGVAGNGSVVDYASTTWALRNKDTTVAEYLEKRTAIPTVDAAKSVCAVVDDEAEEDAELDEDDMFYNETRVSHSTRSDVT